MSTIDRPNIIIDILLRHGADKHEGAVITGPLTDKYRTTLPSDKPMRLMMGPRFTAETILEYVTGFGGTAWKLIYGLYPDGMDAEKAEENFLATGNIKPGTRPSCLMWNGNLTEAGKDFLFKHMNTKERMEHVGA